jgi:hypothetical protein
MGLNMKNNVMINFKWENIRDGLGICENDNVKHIFLDAGHYLKYAIDYPENSNFAMYDLEKKLRKYFMNVLKHNDISIVLKNDVKNNPPRCRRTIIEITNNAKTEELMKTNQKITEYDAQQIKLGNISFNDFLNGIGIKPENILNYSLDNIYDAQPSLISSGKMKHKDLKLTLSIVTSNRFNTNGNLPKLSKHSRKYNITLLKTYDIFKNAGDNYHSATLEYYFKYQPKIKNGTKVFRGPLISVETIQNIVGLPKKEYHNFTDTIFNNGWKYVYHLKNVWNISNEDIEKIVEKLEASKILNGYYKKVFIDGNKDLQIIILKKKHKSFYGDGIPKLNKHHVWSILGINSYEYGKCNIRKFVNGYELEIYDPEYKQELYPDQIKEKLKKVFGEHYELSLMESAENCTDIIFENLTNTINYYDDSSDGLKRLLKTKVELSRLLDASGTLLEYMIRHKNNMYIMSHVLDISEEAIQQLLFENVASSEIVENILKNLK